MMATGLHQDPVDEPVFYWRLRDHARFLRAIGCEFESVEPRMSRDFLVTSKNQSSGKKTEAILQEWLKTPFRTIEHLASVRPATLERRPFVGFHPVHPAVGILNGMGTKGCSLAPYFAHQLVEHITQGIAIRPDADVRRFTKILSR